MDVETHVQQVCQLFHSLFALCLPPFDSTSATFSEMSKNSEAAGTGNREACEDATMASKTIAELLCRSGASILLFRFPPDMGCASSNLGHMRNPCCLRLAKERLKEAMAADTGSLICEFNCTLHIHSHGVVPYCGIGLGDSGILGLPLALGSSVMATCDMICQATKGQANWVQQDGAEIITVQTHCRVRKFRKLRSQKL